MDVKRVLAFFRDAIHRMPFRNRLLAIYGGVILLGMTVLILVADLLVRNISEKQISYSAQQSFSQTYEYLSYKVETVLTTAQTVENNGVVQNILLENYTTDKESDKRQQYTDMCELEDTLQAIGSANGLYVCTLYVDDRLFYSEQDYYFSSLEDLTGNMEFAPLFDGTDSYLWTPPRETLNPTNYQYETIISYYKPIISKYLNTQIGVQRVSMEASEFSSVLKDALSVQGGLLYIVNRNDQLIGASNLEQYRTMAGSEIARKTVENAGKWEVYGDQGTQYLCYSQAIENTDWMLVAMIPYEAIMQEENTVRGILFSIAFLIIAICGVLIYFFSRSFTRRLSILSNTMHEVEKGNLQVELKTKDSDEIGMLYQAFNYMLRNMNALVKEQYENGKAIKSAELKALQAQINPHFLYNTLDLINWEAMDHNAPEIAEISRALARYYKISLNRGEDLISLNEELRHVETYVQIQNYRFDNRISLHIDVPDELRDLKIQKIVLQPLVENAILHGMLMLEKGERGTVTITGWKQSGDLFLTVKDEGVGMPASQLRNILTDKPVVDRHGYGIRNIHKRLQLQYGEKYGLHFDSTLGKGTTVTIRIPMDPPT